MTDREERLPTSVEDAITDYRDSQLKARDALTARMLALAPGEWAVARAWFERMITQGSSNAKDFRRVVDEVDYEFKVRGRPQMIDEVATRIAALWRSGMRHPELGRSVQSEYPALDLSDFNDAADIAWRLICDNVNGRGHSFT